LLLRPIFLLAVLFPLLFPAMPRAAVIDQIREDFRPVTGYVIMPVGEEYLIDLDAANGLQVGDLIAVVREGEKIVHPVTKEVLGSLDEVKGVLQVTRIKSGYSYARPVVPAKGDISRGDKVRRYANLPATFWDYTGQGEKFYPELKAALPELEWPGYEAAQAQRPEVPEQAKGSSAQLFFLLRRDGLQVRGPGLQMLRTYPLPEAVQAAPPAAAVAAPTPPLPAPVAAPVPIPVPVPATAESGVSWERQPAGREGSTLSFPDLQSLGSLPGGTAMADFVLAGDRLLLASTDGSELRVFQIGEKLNEVASGDTARPGEFLSVHWWQPEAGGPLYLAATLSVELNEPYSSYVGHKAVGAVFRLDENRLVPVREGINYILGTFDRDGDGRNETLLGQAFDRDIFFGQVKELRLDGGDIEAGEFPVALPRIFSVEGSTFADLTGDGSPETVTVRNRVLYIYSGEKLLYEGRQKMGGSISQMEYYVNPGLKEADLSTQAFEVPPVVHDFDGDGAPELVVISSEGKTLTMPGIGPGIDKAWLAVLKYRDGMFVKGTIGEEVDRPIQGLYLSDDRAYLVTTGESSLLGKKGKSHLLSFPLK